MEYNFYSAYTLKDFFKENSQQFETALLNEAVNVKDKINEILLIGNIDLVNNAHKLVFFIIDDQDQELQAFAVQEGIAWAKHSLTLSFKLEWVQAIRRTLWKFIKLYYEYKNQFHISNFFKLEKQINNRVDTFLNRFFISYSEYKDTLIKKQKELVENLSVPIIPINSNICILPLIGAIDIDRAQIIEEKVLTEIGRLRFHTLIMDLSGVAYMNADVIAAFMRIINGISLMGCKTVITGLRKEIVRDIANSGQIINFQTKTYGTLQQALKMYF